MYVCVCDVIISNRVCVMQFFFSLAGLFFDRGLIYNSTRDAKCFVKIDWRSDKSNAKTILFENQ